MRRLTIVLGLVLTTNAALIAQSRPAAVQLIAPVAGPLPVLPADNWWNQDISRAPVDPRSADFVSFIGPTRRLHPDFGGFEFPGSHTIYGFPYIVVGGDQPKRAVAFDYWGESDGVNLQTGQRVPSNEIVVTLVHGCSPPGPTSSPLQASVSGRLVTFAWGVPAERVRLRSGLQRSDGPRPPTPL